MPIMDTGLFGASIEEIKTISHSAEALGFSGLVTAEAAHEPFLPLVVAAEHSDRLDLMTGIAVAFPRSPMVTAYTAWDLQRYSRGRFLLGLGTQVKGHNQRRFSVSWDRPGPRLRELILSLHAIWDCWQNGTALEFNGEFYHFDLMTPFFNPGPQEWPQPPIYISGVNPYMCRLAGELCEGFHVHPLHTRKYISEYIRPLLAEGAKRSGRNPQELVLTSSCFVVTGDNDEQLEAAARAIKQQISFYASTRTYAPVLAAHGWEEVGPRLNSLSRQGKWEEMADLISDEMLTELAVIGRREHIGDLLRRKYDGLLERISLYLPYVPGSDDDWWQDVVTTVQA